MNHDDMNHDSRPNPNRPLLPTNVATDLATGLAANLPADLVAIAGQLDALGERDRGGASPAMVDRVFAASRTRLGAGEAQGTVETLSDERAAIMAGAPADLEESVFAASRRHLPRTQTNTPPLRLVPAEPEVSGMSRPRVLFRLSGLVRLAALVAIAGGALVAYFAFKPGAGALPGGDDIAATDPAPAELTSDEAVEVALDGLDRVLASDDLEMLMADADNLEGMLKAGILDESEFVEKGAM